VEGSVRTVGGDLSPAGLGPTNYHEHVFQATPLLPGDELADPDAGARELADLPRTGFTAVVDATPLGLGRRPAQLPGVAQRAGVHLVATTGRHREAHYGDQPGWCHLGADDLTGILVRELTEGMAMHDEDYLSKPLAAVATAHTREGPVRAGVLKAGIGYWAISAVEGATLEAVAAAHRATGAPVMVHTERCTAAHEVLDLLRDQGVPESRVCLAHADRNPDAGLHTELAERGAYLGHDGAGRAKDWPDSVLLECLAEIAAAGRADRVMLGNDVARRSRYRAYGGMPGLAYLGERFVPQVRQRLGDTLTDRILTNPGRWLAWASAPTDATSGRRSTTASQGGTPWDE
jgi:predicted metal-dependent phosphotriesterase family hydrolase